MSLMDKLREQGVIGDEVISIKVTEDSEGYEEYQKILKKKYNDLEAYEERRVHEQNAAWAAAKNTYID
ncbi:hypothetical protein GF336_05465 [Candidatus Woesearchaeota archaeon]|nr:hypothetical protein [Candidatus Woesearchaeota archaeon]